jgi:hypothetical protein
MSCPFRSGWKKSKPLSMTPHHHFRVALGDLPRLGHVEPVEQGLLLGAERVGLVFRLGVAGIALLLWQGKGWQQRRTENQQGARDDTRTVEAFHGWTSS